MALPVHRKIIAGKIESTRGTEETLTATEAKMVVAEVTYAPDIELHDRNILSTTFSQFAKLVGKQAAVITLKTELKGSSAAGTAPQLGEFLKASGMSEAVAALTSVTYTPSSTNLNNMTIAEYHADNASSGLKHPIAGSMARSSRIVGEIGKASMVEMEFWGKYIATIDAIPLSPALDTIKPPRLLAATFTVDGFAAQIANFTIDFSPQIELIQDISEATGYDHAIMVGRAPTVSFDPQKTLVGSYDWLGKFKSGAEGIFSLVYGTDPGNTITILMNKIQYTSIAEGDRNGLGTFEVTASMNRDTAGDDEFSLAIT